MSPDRTRATYRRMIGSSGELVSLKRGSQSATGLRARVTGFTPQELASGIDQGARKVLLLAEDVEAAIAAVSWPAPAAGAAAVEKDDLLFVRGAPLSVEMVDDSSRRIGGVLMAYEIVAKG